MAHGPEQPGGDQADSVERRLLLRELGISEEEFLPDEAAPPVDTAQLRALARRELPEAKAFEVGRLIAAFRSWTNAFNQVLAESSGEESGKTGEIPDRPAVE